VTDFISYILRGIPFGCVFALVAIGLVLTYKTSGVFNLAFGAQAYVSAAVYYDTHVRHKWPILAAFALAVIVVAPLVGLIMDRAIFRFMRTAPHVARLVAALGLLVAIPQLVNLWFGQSPSFGVEGIWPSSQGSNFAVYHFGDYALNGDQVATLIATAVVVIGLTALFRFSDLGLRMRAVVESSRMTELSGINAGRISTIAWMLSSLVAGLAGVLLAPLFAQVNANNFTILIVAAIAAAAFGRLSSIPLTLLGGILLGIAQGLLGGYLPPASVLAQGLRPSLPFLALFALLIVWPAVRNRREVTDPLAGVDPPPPGLASLDRSRSLTWGTRILAVVVLTGAVLFVVGSNYWLLLATEAVILSIIFLSIVVITGMAGQISLCQATFAAIGAFTTAQLVSNYHASVLLTILAGAVLAAIVGGLLAVPVLRLGGIYLALATFAFALMFESILVPLDWVGGGAAPLKVPRPTIGPVDFASNRSFFFLCIAVLAVVSVLVIFVRGGTIGRYLNALRGSETAAQAIGINPARARIIAMALSAGIAGLGGGLLATQSGLAQPADYNSFLGLFWVVLVVTIGSRTVEGGIQAGIGFYLVDEILKRIGINESWLPILFGLGAMTYAKHPEGILEFQKRKSLMFVQRQLERMSGKSQPAEQAAAAGGAAAVATAPNAPSSEPVGAD
jgi:branched-subunit amino acid ABC-type transport system permease component